MTSLYVPFVSRGNALYRSHLPIAAYVGANGSGKTLAAVHDALTHLDAGRLVLSTVRLLDPDCEHPTPHPNYVPLTDWRQLLDFESGHVLLDEVTGFADSRNTQSMPSQLRTLLVQLRKRDVTLAWTCPDWSMSDVTIRRVTQAATVCRSTLKVSAPGAIWRQARLFLWRTYDAAALDDFTEAKRTKLDPLVRQVFWGPGSRAFRAYDSLASVSLLDHQITGGTCLDCGGRVRRPVCGCNA